MSWLQEARREQEAKEKPAKLAKELAERERRKQIYAYDADLKKHANEVREKLLPRWRALEIDQILVDLRNKVWPKTGTTDKEIAKSEWVTWSPYIRKNDLTKLRVGLSFEHDPNACDTYYFVRATPWTSRLITPPTEQSPEREIKTRSWELSVETTPPAERSPIGDMERHGFAGLRPIREGFLSRAIQDWHGKEGLWSFREIFTMSLHEDRLEAEISPFLYLFPGSGVKQIPLDETVNGGVLKKQIAQWLKESKALQTG